MSLSAYMWAILFRTLCMLLSNLRLISRDFQVTVPRDVQVTVANNFQPNVPQDVHVTVPRDIQVTVPNDVPVNELRRAGIA